MSDKTMYTITDFPETARELTRKNMAILYRDSAHHDQIEKGINYGGALTTMKKQRDPENIEKGGEGTRGGKVIGHTKSGKPVYDSYDHSGHSDFTHKDHKDAVDLHNKMHDESKEAWNGHHAKQGDAHLKAYHDLKPKKQKATGSTADKKDQKEFKEWKAGNESAKHDEDFKHHRMMAGYHAGMEKKIADNMIDLKSSSDKDLHKHADKMEPTRAKHAELESEHAKKAAALHDPKKHGPWNSTIPGHDEAMAYGHEHYAKKEIKKAEETLIGACIENMIEKGEISDTLGRGYGPGSEPVKFVKTGKEIKEKIPTILTQLATEVGKCEGQMAEIQKEIGLDPSIPRKSYAVKSVSIMEYDWDLCNPAYDKVNQCYPAPSVQNQLCSKYNSLGYMLISMQEDVATLNVMQGNLEDGKKYTLSVSQLIALGF